MFKYLLPFIFISQVQAATCEFQWEYPIADQQKIDGFEIFINNVKTIDLPSNVRKVSCSKAKVVSGSNNIKIRSFGGTQISPFSSSLDIFYNPKSITIDFPK